MASVRFLRQTRTPLRIGANSCRLRRDTNRALCSRGFRAAAGGEPELGLPYIGPSTSIGKIGAPWKEAAYKVANNDSKVRVLHHNHLKPSQPSNEHAQNTQGTSKSSEEWPQGWGEAMDSYPLNP